MVDLLSIDAVSHWIESRSIQDFRLLLTEFPVHWFAAILGGLFTGVGVAYKLWYRNVNALVHEQLRLLHSLFETKADRESVEALEKKIDALDYDGKLNDLEQRVILLEAEIKKLRRELMGMQSTPLPVPTNKGRKVSPPKFVVEDEGGNFFKPSSDERVVSEVFIMDISDSMKALHKLKTCKEHLIKSIEELDEGAKYQVIFFSKTAHFADEDNEVTHPEWRLATKANKQATIERIKSVKTERGNEWHCPFILAMNLEPPPKRINFLTDGQKSEAKLLSRGIIDLVKRVKGETKVNTTAFMAPKASPPLIRIAEETGGTHTLVLAGGERIRNKEKLTNYLGARGIECLDSPVVETEKEPEIAPRL
ncbi:MAG: VWA domain-containing protein [Verrucomicrobiales bacterium]|nr:VWA domain-containing protein [Verrucomicrobiales bacterium]